MLPGGKHVLSHDQVEAVLMRRAGYEVRVLPEEDLGWEENPPTLIEFIRRDLRWCQGNMQYWRFLVMPGLKPVSRCQLAIAILMFLGSPAWVGLLVLGTVLALRQPGTIDRRALWLDAAGRHPVHVVCAKNRNRHRRVVAPATAARLWRRSAAAGERH